MKANNYLKAGLIFLLIIAGCLQRDSKREVLFQVSTINALLEGVYDGDITFRELAQQGDLGIGTFNALDGEMVGVNGEFYQVKADGKVYRVTVDTKTPFAAVTFFDPDLTWQVDNISSFAELQEHLDKLIPTENIFYAIKIEAVFDYVKTRSVPAQSKPYPALSEVVKTQPVFEFTDMAGTLVGFRCPDYVKGVNVPGYHLHFISQDKAGGGHLLDCRFSRARVQLDETGSFFMVLPAVREFQELDLSQDKEAELKRVESE